MTPQQPEDGAEVERQRQRERRRLAEIFGDVLPESTRDDQDEPSAGDGREGPAADGRSGTSRDSEILRDVPPHHT